MRLHVRRWRSRELRRESRERLADMLVVWTKREKQADGDELVEEVRKAAAKGHAQGGVYNALYEILRNAEGKGRACGDRRLKTLYKGGDKKQGMVTGAEEVRTEAREQGEVINKGRPAALAVVKDIIRWVDEGGGGREREKDR